MASEAPLARERKRHGRHYTPPALARFLAERLLEHVPPPMSGVLRVLDPACGDGELLFALAARAALRWPKRAGAPAVRLELVGYDLDPEALAVAAQRSDAAGVEVQWRVGDFLAAAADLTDGSFDVVITNPPYVRTQQLGTATARVLSKRFGLRGRIDLTHPFVATLPRLLVTGGALGLLCANRFLTTKAGANVRRMLHTELSPVELYDLGDTRLFDAAVLPAVTIATRGGGAAVCRYVAAYAIADGAAGAAGEGTVADRAVAEGTDLFEALRAARGSTVAHGGRVFAVEVGTLATDDGEDGTGHHDTGADEPVSRDRVWRLSRDGVDSWLAQIGAATWRNFGAVARIRVGIKTTADRVFISDRWDAVDPSPEPELLWDLITHHDLGPWRIEHARHTRVLYPYDPTESRRTTVDLAEFPCTAQYLDKHSTTLRARHYLTASGREWFEIWVPQRPDLWREPKIVFPDISERPRFALDRSGAVVNGDCYWISLPDLAAAPDQADELAYLLMAVANSTLGLRYYDAVCGNRLYSGRRRWITQYVSRLPLPDPAARASAGVIALARELVAGRLPDAAATAELDERVAAAFGIRSGGPRGALGMAEADHG
ncbi:Eco57I restriction-modification methylase domain-containing protein [Nocardia callitridis]|uniref:site-specific DNA-methyltransferase (adenine-specific) n=1 Tax=Nocardia callitridis TaxID=648753 RepID=A0ABP9KFX7_9NOCA